MTKVELTIKLLTHFLKAKPSRMIHALETFEDYTTQDVKRAIYALTELGLLKKVYGEKSGSVYFTTREGRQHLESIQEPQ